MESLFWVAYLVLFVNPEFVLSAWSNLLWLPSEDFVDLRREGKGFFFILLSMLLFGVFGLRKILQELHSALRLNMRRNGFCSFFPVLVLWSL